jgi:NTP-dependent ternary system trypsin peptidase co-occuring protein
LSISLFTANLGQLLKNSPKEIEMQALSVETDSGRKVYIEVVEAIAPIKRVGGGAVAGKDKAAELVGKLQDVGDAIADVCKTLQKRIDEALESAKPSELTLEFGVKLAGEAGIPLVTKGSVEGTFQVSAKWIFSDHNDSK